MDRVTDVAKPVELRDYFASHAPPPPKWYLDAADTMKEAAERMSEWAYAYADSMLEARQ